VPGGTWGHIKPVRSVSGTGLLPPLAGLSRPFPYAPFFFLASVSAETDSYAPQPNRCSDCSLPTHLLFRLFPVRSPLLGKSLLISSPRSTEMFQFPRFPRIYYVFIHACRLYYWRRVAPFGYPRIKACLPLPGAFRCLPRPSSALSAKASTVCPFFLDLFTVQFSRCSLTKYQRLMQNGGDERNRTADPLLARQVLSQLSYTPTI
jgi:hypothetical protein